MQEDGFQIYRTGTLYFMKGMPIREEAEKRKDKLIVPLIISEL
jgi:hypothetical protein